MRDAAWASSMLVERIRARPWGLAVATITGDAISVEVEMGDDEISTDATWQVGSVSKTVAGVLLALAVARQEASLDTRLDEVFDLDGGAADVTLKELASHSSGLPRLPPNLDLRAVDPDNPYAAFDVDDLLAGLREVTLGDRGSYAYSNFGFMTLGLVLERRCGDRFGSLCQSRLFDPLGMSTAGCPPPDSGRVIGYRGARRHPWWDNPLPGAGGIGMSINDLAAYLRGHVDPPAGPLGDAIVTATTLAADRPPNMGLGWQHVGGGWIHDGGTGGFSSFAGFHRPTRTAVGLLANSADTGQLSSVGIEVLTELARSATEGSHRPI